MIKQHVKKETKHKGKEADVHVNGKVPKGSRGVTFTYTAPNARPY